MIISDIKRIFLHKKTHSLNFTMWLIVQCTRQQIPEQVILHLTLHIQLKTLKNVTYKIF